MPKLALVLASAAALLGSPAAAQMPSIPLVGVSFGVDTTAPDVGDVVRLVRAYLAGPGLVGDSAARAARLWSNAGEPGHLGDDLTRSFAYQGFPATVLAVTSAMRGDSVYIVKILYARADSVGGPVRPLALQRLYAVRAPGSPFGWQLSGALPRVTMLWQRLTVGPIAFRYAPGLHPDTARARRAARFVDSVARHLDVPAPGRIEYLVTHAPDEYFRAIGLDFFGGWASGRGSSIGGQGGYQLVLAGDPAAGEAYFHELTHAILAAARCCANGVVSEGLATFLGGSRQRGRDEMYRVLSAYQRAHPDATLKGVLEGSAPGTPAETSDAAYATDALVVDAVYRHAGWAGVRGLTQLPGRSDAILAALRSRVPSVGADLDAWWRRAALDFASVRILVR